MEDAIRDYRLNSTASDHQSDVNNAVENVQEQVSLFLNSHSLLFNLIMFHMNKFSPYMYVRTYITNKNIF